MSDLAKELEKLREEENALIRAQKREIAKLYKRLRKHETITASVVDAIEAVMVDIPPIVAPPAPKKSRKRTVEYGLLDFSDWQTGAISSTFNPAVLRERILENAMPAIRKIIEGRRHGAKLDEVVVISGGDMVDGSALRENHAFEVMEDVMEQATVTLPNIFNAAMLMLLEYVPKVTVKWIRGNHGRNGLFRGNLNPARVNWDTVAGRVCAKHFKGEKRIEFDVEADDFMQVFKVGGSTIMSIHGDQFRGGGGFTGLPVYDITRKMAKWRTNLQIPFDDLYFGHFHQINKGEFGPMMYFINGSPQTDSGYAREKLAATNIPTQLFNIYSDKHPHPIAEHVIYL